jgi:hypothetical protein
MKLSLITNCPDLAIPAEDAGIDRIFIDLEKLGKARRQHGHGLFLSDHRLEDIAKIRKVVRKAELMVRIDPLHPDSRDQIRIAIESGADVIMLPYFHTLEEAQEFIDLVAQKAATVLLVETREAASILAELTRLHGVSEIHLGLNDLSISLGKRFLFDLIPDGEIDVFSDVLRSSGLPFGVGGMACLQRRDLLVDPELVLAYQVCQGASRGWLGRSFRSIEPAKYGESVRNLRDAIQFWTFADAVEKEQMRAELLRQIRLAHNGSKKSQSH